MKAMKFIPGTDKMYSVSRDGNIYSYRKKGKIQGRMDEPRMMKPFKNNAGYLQVILKIDGKLKPYLVHRLVAMAFVKNPQNLNEVNHKDEDKLNNCADNLEWCTHKYNQNYGSLKRRVIEKRGDTYMIDMFLKPDILNAIIIMNQSDIRRTKYIGYGKVVLEDDMRNKVREFDSALEAAAFLGVPSVRVRGACEKCRKINGFYLRKED